MADPKGRSCEQRGLWYEELTVGTGYRHAPGRTIGEADNTLFSALTMNQQALHVDESFAAQQEFGGRLVNSMMTLAMVVGLSVNQLTQGTLVANLGFDEVAFPAPLFHGDTAACRDGRRDTSDQSMSRPHQGIVTLQHEGHNQNGELVVEATRTVLMADGSAMKPIAPESGPAYLFCPASRPDRYQKALDAADFAIFDLEDAVAPADKAAARQALIDNPVDPDAVIVRVNAIGTPDHALDLEALESTSYGRIMVPKAEDPEAIARLDRYEVIALCETARGVLRAPADR